MPRSTRATARSITKSSAIKSPTKNTCDQRRASTTFPARELGSARLQKVQKHGSIFDELSPKSPRRSIFDVEEVAIDNTWPATRPSTVRRFSQVYGHGRPLESALDSAPTGAKRRASNVSEALSPKKVRFDPEEVDESQLRGQGAKTTRKFVEVDPSKRYDIARKDLVLDSGYILHPDRHLLTALRDATDLISISQISVLLRILQKLTGDFAAQYFADKKEDNHLSITRDMLAFPLRDLKLKHPALYLTTVNVLDASASESVDNPRGYVPARWAKFFTHPNYRPYLVSAILGEWFTQRIFKDPAFGLSDEGRAEIESIDKAYIYSDSFIRVKKRGEVVKRHRSMNYADTWLKKAADKLVHELMMLLAPLLSYADPADPHNKHVSLIGPDNMSNLRAALCELIINCATVNLAIVRTGETGIVVRPAPRLEKGKQFFPTAPMECVNPTMCEYTRPESRRGEMEELAVKMTCWPRMEAWVPHGLDKEEMAQIERGARILRAPVGTDLNAGVRNRDSAKVPYQHKESFCWECSEHAEMWEVLPVELQHTEAERRDKRRRIERSNQSLKTHRKEQHKKDGKGGGDDPECSDPSTQAEEESSPEDNKTPLRGAWITEFTCLAPHTVYCEWVQPGKSKVDPYKTRQTYSLEKAIKAARADRLHLDTSKLLSLKMEDLLLRIWDFYAAHNIAIEWSAFLVAVLVYFSRAGTLSALSDICTTPLKIAGHILDQVGETLGMKALSRAIVGFSDNIPCGISSSNLADQLHSARIVISGGRLSSAHSFVDSNLGVFKTALRGIVAPLRSSFVTATGQGKTRLSAGISSMTHFVGQRQPFTSNPIINIKPLKSAVSSAKSVVNSQAVAIMHTQPFTSLHTLPNQFSRSLGPTTAASSFSSAALGLVPQVTEPADLIPIPIQNERESMGPPTMQAGNIDNDMIVFGESTTSLSTTPTSTVYATSQPATSTITVTAEPRGLLHSAVSRMVNAAGDYVLGGGKRGKTRTLLVERGEQITTVMPRGNRKVV